jgi:hypothetical protein
MEVVLAEIAASFSPPPPAAASSSSACCAKATGMAAMRTVPECKFDTVMIVMQDDIRRCFRKIVRMEIMRRSAEEDEIFETGFLPRHSADS